MKILLSVHKIWWIDLNGCDYGMPLALTKRVTSIILIINIQEIIKIIWTFSCDDFWIFWFFQLVWRLYREHWLWILLHGDWKVCRQWIMCHCSYKPDRWCGSRSVWLWPLDPWDSVGPWLLPHGLLLDGAAWPGHVLDVLCTWYDILIACLFLHVTFHFKVFFSELNSLHVPVTLQPIPIFCFIFVVILSG